MRSRPVRWAATMAGADESRVDYQLREVRVAIRVDPSLASMAPTRETVILATNLLLRLYPSVTIIAASADVQLASTCKELGAAIRGHADVVTVLQSAPARGDFDAVLNVGCDPFDGGPGVTLNSAGWLARVAPNGSGLPACTSQDERNPLGALCAACLGVGSITMDLLGLATIAEGFEIRLWDYAAGPVGSLDAGPTLPQDDLTMHAALIGCGGVGNGWAYAVRKLPVGGRIEAVDQQRLRPENVGTYIFGTTEALGRPKAELVADVLRPAIHVTPHAEPFELFRIRLERDLVEMPTMVINGLDSIPTRHAVQRLWPEVVIDMASAGSTTQLISHHRGQRGICLLEALMSDTDPLDQAGRAALMTGLTPERVRDNPTDFINEVDVARAPECFRADLEAARIRGQQICGRITNYHLNEEEDSAEFVPAVPFVTAFSGIAGAAETLKVLMGEAQPLHQQFDFRSMQIRALDLRCSSDCECQAATAASRDDEAAGRRRVAAYDAWFEGP